MATTDPAVMPTAVTPHVGWFDRFACHASVAVSRAWFFTACLLLVVVWAPSYFLLHNLDLWQLLINTATTIITFLLVALLQNSAHRSDQATQHKLNALAYALGELMAAVADDAAGNAGLSTSVCELRAAVGLEERESS